MAGATIQEIRKLVDTYVKQEDKHRKDVTPIRGLATINREIDSCEKAGQGTTLSLRSMTQVLKLCHEEGKSKRSSTGELLSLAIDYHLGGHDPAKAFKRAKSVQAMRAAEAS